MAANSVMATRMALKLGDYAVTEAGFGADLGAEKFFDIKCRMARLHPSAVVVVATVRALKMHGGKKKDELKSEDLEALEKGLPNLVRHIKNIREVFGLPCVVAINRFPDDTERELRLIEEKCREWKVNAALSEVWGKGSEGGVRLAEEVVRLCEEENSFRFCYEDSLSIEEKLQAIARRVYGGVGVEWTPAAKKQAGRFAELGMETFPCAWPRRNTAFPTIPNCWARRRGSPSPSAISKSLRGAGFIVALTGEIMTMPGLPKIPAAERIDVDAEGKISGLF